MADKPWFKTSARTTVVWNGTNTVCYGEGEVCCYCADFKTCLTDLGNPDVEITLAGIIAGSSCSGGGPCTNLNTTWNIGPLVETNPPCIWDAELATGVCGYTIKVHLSLDVDDGVQFQLHLGQPNGFGGFNFHSLWSTTTLATIESITDGMCAGDTESLGGIVQTLNNGHCNASSATATIAFA